MQRKSSLKPQDVVALYTESHLTMEEIGKIAGVTRQGIKKVLDKAGVKASEGEWLDTTCSSCGNTIHVRRKRWRINRKTYCNQDCYIASLQSTAYKPRRHGQRIARLIVKQYFDLQPGHVTHHKDGDNRNNDRSNLLVFANQSDHLKHHRGGNINPIWDGAA